MRNRLGSRIHIRFSLLAFVFAIMLFVVMPRHVSADYMLPYPSAMPGNKVYGLSRLADRAGYYWHWGDIAKTKYFTALSDKYLVEAKTLFEYRQYLLAVDALGRSDGAYRRIADYVGRAYAHGKEAEMLVESLGNQASVHIQVLESIRSGVPETFVWTPEDADETVLNLAHLLDESITFRVQGAAHIREITGQ